MQLLLAVTLTVIVALAAHASDFSDDLKARRARVMDRLGADTMLILWSAPTARYSLDVDYEYRQDSNLYYLTGVTRDETMLVLMPGNASQREILFIKDRNPVREHWTGRRLSNEEAAAQTGIETVLPASQFEPFVSAMLTRRGFGPVDDAQTARFFEALAAGRARVALTLEPARGVSDPLSAPLVFAQKIRDRFVGFQVTDATSVLTDLRMVKTAYERQLLIKSLEISSEAQKAGMRAARPGAFEYEVKAAIEAVHRGRGASSWSYPSIVGSGPNATILHYADGSRQIQAGDLLLVDAACNFEYASGDITRTYPVSGTFSPLQKDLYQIVLQAQDEGMKVAKPGASTQDIHKKTVEVVKAGLLKLGLISDANGDQYRMWYTHGASHYIGIDVHDVGDRNRPLEPGMAFVIEPGIYIRQSVLDGLPRTPENNALIERIQPAVKKYADLGVRIEDSFVLEETGLKRLSASVPRTIEEIEAFLRKPPSTLRQSEGRPERGRGAANSGPAAGKAQR
jgi:Xaa-Pro aminopeptidase